MYSGGAWHTVVPRYPYWVKFSRRTTRRVFSVCLSVRKTGGRPRVKIGGDRRFLLPRRRLLSQDGALACVATSSADSRRSQAPRLRSGMASQQWKDKRCALCCLLLRSASRPVPRDQQTGAQELPEEAAAAAAANLEQVNAQLEGSGEPTLTFDDVCFDAKRLHNGGGKRCFDVVERERKAGGDRRGTRSTPAFTPEPPQARPRPGEVEQLMAAAGPSIDAVLGDGSLEYPVTTRRASALAAGAAPAERREAEGLERRS